MEFSSFSEKSEALSLYANASEIPHVSRRCFACCKGHPCKYVEEA